MKKIKSERWKLLRVIESFLEGPMIVLGFVWLMLLIMELVTGGSPWVERISLVIWGIFIVDFAVKFLLAPEKGKYLKRNVITMISLAVPAFRVLRIVRFLRLLRVTRGLRLVRVLGSLSRSVRALSSTMKRRAFGYVMLLTLIVTFGGAAGMYAFEKDVAGGLSDYGTALWWTAMIMTTLGSEYWPQTVEGRILCIVIALFAFGVFGYITATIATFFIGRDAEDSRAGIAGSAQIEQLRAEISELKEMLSGLDRKAD